MNQYEKENALFKIDGYYLKAPHESEELAFVRSKNEVIAELLKEIENIKMISYQDYKNHLK